MGGVAWQSDLYLSRRRAGKFELLGSAREQSIPFGVFFLSNELPSSTFKKKKKSSCAETGILKLPLAKFFFYTFVCLSLFIWSPLHPGSPKASLKSSQVPFVTSNGRTDIPEERRQ